MFRRLGFRLGRQGPLLVAFGLFVALLAVYWQTLAPGLLQGDGGELQVAAVEMGIPHPTGYPLYVLLGWLWIKVLPIGRIAWRMNLFSAVCGAAAAVLVYGINLRLVKRILPALAGACFLAFSPTFWKVSSATEVYALHALFVAALLYLLLLWRDAGPKRSRFLLAMALTFGLSLSHHRMTILMAPAIILFLILETQSDQRRLGLGGGTPPLPVRQGVLVGVAFLAGLLPHIHLFVYQLKRGGTVQHVVFDIILGGHFAGFVGPRTDPLRILWGLPREQMGIVGLILALFGLAWLAWRQRRVAWLLGVAWATSMLFCLFYRAPDIEDFSIAIVMILAIWAGCAAGWAGARQRRVARPWAGEPRPYLGGQASHWALELGLLALALLSLRNQELVRGNVAALAGDIEARAQQVAGYPFEPGSTLIADWELSTAIKYLQVAEGVELGVRVEPAKLWRDEDCAALLAAAEVGGGVYAPPEVRITRLPDGYGMDSVPGFLRIMAGRAGLPRPYTRLDRPLHPQLVLEGVQRQEQLLILRWLVTGMPLDRDYTTYAHFFDSEGNPIGQTDKGAGGEELTCWYPPTSWPVGTVTQDLFVIPSETASIRTGAYWLQDGQIESLGDATLVELGP